MQNQKNQDPVLSMADFFPNIEIEAEQIEKEDDLGEQIKKTLSGEVVEEKPKKEVVEEQEEEQQDSTEQVTEEEDEQVETPKKVEPNNSVYTELLRDYIDSGEWQDAVVEIDGEEKKLSELESLDKEKFLQIKEVQKGIIDEERKSKYLDIDGLDEDTLKLIDIKKKGGDIKELLQYEAEMVHPLRDLDLENEKVQAWLLSEQYRSQGMSDDAIQTQIAADKKNFVLDEKSRRVIDNINKSYKSLIDNKAKEQERLVAEEMEKQKSLKKELSEQFKRFNLKDTTSRRFLDSITKKEKGGVTKLDQLINQAKENPEKLAKLVYMLEDEEGFLKFNGAKKVNENNLRTIKLVSKTSHKDKDFANSETEEEKGKKNPFEGMVFKK